MKTPKLLLNGLILIPIVCAIFALTGYRYFLHVAIPVVCGLLIGCFANKDVDRSRWLLVAALAFSIVGDWFLKHRNDDDMRFVYGIALFFIAHICYLAFCLKNGNIRLLLLFILLAGYLPFFIFRLMPAISDSVLQMAVLAYMLISCVSLAAAQGLRLSTMFARWLFFAGIACIVFSDTLIAVYEFLNEGKWLYDHLMTPTYYAAHILITYAVTARI
ncbi:MAG: lysoplasmalogenase [Dysgonamonadaceae bacterium]|jgi:uncharacterized membrane protein YhhN|nr:lysoplasmalogenase [Dysgonamonadaceae bacterium]